MIKDLIRKWLGIVELEEYVNQIDGEVCHVYDLAENGLSDLSCDIENGLEELSKKIEKNSE